MIKQIKTIKTILYTLQFIESARFITSSLSNLVNNLAKGIYKVKSKYRNNCYVIHVVKVKASIYSTIKENLLLFCRLKLTPNPHIFFHLKSFLWKGLLTVKVRTKFIDQILSYISFCFEIRVLLTFLIYWSLELRKEYDEPLFLNLIFTYVPIMTNSGKFKQISLAIKFKEIYCIIPP